MHHYEIMILIHPNQSERTHNIIKKYKNIVESQKGKIHKIEDLGKKKLAYQIKKLHKAQYVLMKIECNKQVLRDLNLSFKFNDAIIRNLIFKTSIQK